MARLLTRKRLADDDGTSVEDAIVRAAAGHIRLETVLEHYGRIKKQDALAGLRQARCQATEATVVKAR